MEQDTNKCSTSTVDNKQETTAHMESTVAEGVNVCNRPLAPSEQGEEHTIENIETTKTTPTTTEVPGACETHEVSKEDEIAQGDTVSKDTFIDAEAVKVAEIPKVMETVSKNEEDAAQGPEVLSDIPLPQVTNAAAPAENSTSPTPTSNTPTKLPQPEEAVTATFASEAPPPSPAPIQDHEDCRRQIAELQASLEQLQTAHAQKDNMIVLIQRENAILEKEKQQFRKEMELANKEKESTVIKFATKEKLLIDAKKEKEAVEKQLAEARKSVKNVSIRFQAVNEEKSRFTYMMDEKCNEVRKYQRECEKLKTDCSHLESKLKYHINKLNMEVEAKQALEKKLEEERNAPNKLEEKANEKLKMEYEAQSILLKHEITRKVEAMDNLAKEHSKQAELLKQVQEQLSRESAEKTQLAAELLKLQEEHNSVQNAYSEEMLNSAKLRGQLEELQVLKTRNAFNEEKISELDTELLAARQKLEEDGHDLRRLQEREQELLTINREMSESIVKLQNDSCLAEAKAQGLAAENSLLKSEQAGYDARYTVLEEKLHEEVRQKAEERQLLTRHLSEKTKMYETVKQKLDNMLGDMEATQHKHTTVVKELQRELQKYKKSSSSHYVCGHCQGQPDMMAESGGGGADAGSENGSMNRRSHSRSSSASGHSMAGQPSDISESETVASTATAMQADVPGGPSKKHLVERILRLQQASARQTEKIDFLENHTLSLVAELQKKSKVVQYYMLRDQEGALTSSKSDQHKTELAKYGNGVMSAIYNGVKGSDAKGMTLDLSLEINKKLQAVLEDTLLKNITLKENMAVLGMEVDTLTKRVQQLQASSGRAN